MFEFATATRIIFGEGTVQQVAPAATQWGRRVLWSPAALRSSGTGSGQT